jgi:hypothetical protein
MGSTETKTTVGLRVRRWNSVLVFLVVGLAYAHANFHPTNLPSLILDFPIWLPDEPLGDTTGVTGWPFRYMQIEPGSDHSFWSMPAIGGATPSSYRVAFAINVMFGLLAAGLASYQFSRAVITEHGLGFMMASFLAMAACVTLLLRSNIPLWDKLADHLSVAVILASLFAIWETVFARVADQYGKLVKVQPKERRRPRNAVEWYMAGPEHQYQRLSDSSQA